jgi:hypothetical protein
LEVVDVDRAFWAFHNSGSAGQTTSCPHPGVISRSLRP